MTLFFISRLNLIVDIGIFQCIYIPGTLLEKLAEVGKKGTALRLWHLTSKVQRNTTKPAIKQQLADSYLHK